MQKLRRDRFIAQHFAVEGAGTSGAKGIAPDVGPQETDPEWQPV